MAKRQGSSELNRREDRQTPPNRENIYKSLSAKEPRIPTTRSFLPAIDSRPEAFHSAQMPKPQDDMSSIELRARVRELEVQMLDLHSTLDRRLMAFHEEIPNRLQTELKLIQDRDNIVWRENNTKVQQLQETVRGLVENLKRPLDSLNSEQGSIKKRLDELEIRTVTVAREVEYSQKAPKALTYEAPYPSVEPAEVQSLKQQLSEEQKRRELQLSDLHAQIQSLHSVLRANEQENNRRYQQYRTEMLATHQESVSQTMKLDKTREDKLRSENEYLRSVMSNLQSRVDEESKQRQQGESDFKQWTDEKVSFLHQAMKSDERGLLEREKNLIHQLQDGMVTLYEIVTKVKEHGAVQLTKTQTLMNENIKDIALAVSSIKDSLWQRVEALETTEREEIRLRMEFQGAMQGHFQTFAQLIDSHVTRIDNQQQTSENRLRSDLLELKETHDAFESTLETWKAKVDQSLTIEVDALRSRLDLIATLLTKLEHESSSQLQTVKREAAAVESRFADEIAKVNGKIQFEAGVTDQNLNTTVQRVADALSQQVHDLKVAVGKNVSELEEEVQKRLEELDESLKLQFRSDLSTAVAKEAASRQTDIASFENYIKQHISTTERNILSEVDSQGNELVRRVEAVRDEVKELMLLVQGDKTEAGRVTDDIYSALQDLEGKLKDWTRDECTRQVEDAKGELTLVIETERELGLSELDKARKAIASDYEGLKTAFNTLLSTENQKTRAQVLELTMQEKALRELMQKDLLKRLDELGTATKEAFNQSAESLKAVCKALIIEEKAERSHSEELILSSINRRISKLEEVIKHEQKVALTNASTTLDEFIQSEKLKWEELETSRRSQQGVLKEKIRTIDDRLSVSLLLRELVDGIADSHVQTSLAAIDTKVAESAQELTIAIEQKSHSLLLAVENATGTMAEMDKELKSQLAENTGDIEFRLEAGFCLNKVIDLLEFHEANGRFQVIEGNMEKLYKNLGQLDSVLTEQVEENKKTITAEMTELKQELVDKVELVESQQDLHTIQIDDLTVKTTLEDVLSKVSSKDQLWYKTSLQLLLDELSGLKNKVAADAQHAGASEKNTMSVLQHLADSHDKAISDIKELAKPAFEASGKLNIFEERLSQMEQRMNATKAADSDQLAQKVQKFGEEVAELRKALESVKFEKAAQDKDISSRLDHMAASMVGVQGALSQEMERNAGSQNRVQQSVLEQLERVTQMLNDMKQKT